MATTRGEGSQRVAAILEMAEPLYVRDGRGLDALVEKAAQCQIVLLGEASHGTHEFYALRQQISRRLISEHGFGMIAAEADWPDSARLDDFVRGRGTRPAPLGGVFGRFPRWMWRNAEFRDFLDWLRTHNASRPPQEGCSFHGLDLYSLNSSIHEIISFLDNRDPALGLLARARYGCILPFADEPQDYGHAVLMRQHRDCEGEVAAMLADLLRRQINSAMEEGREFFDAQQNARIIRNAERYYRAIFRGSVESWNVRDRHMFETLLELLDMRGPQTRSIVWAHNTHVGDASATQMGGLGEVNIGQLVQEHFVHRAFSVGFGTHTGTVTAAHDWGETPRVMPVRPSIEGSYERLMNETGLPAFTLDLRDGGPNLRGALSGRQLERAIGVIYRPETERLSHYFTAELSRQFDAYVWVAETHAVSALDDAATEAEDKEAGHPFAREDR